VKVRTPAPCLHQFFWLAAALLGLLVIPMAGCTVVEMQPELHESPMSVPEGSPAMKQQALSFTPPPGKAGLYVIRLCHFYNDSYYGGSVVLFDISLDYQDFGSLETNSYLFATLPAGNHVLGPLHFTVAAGSNYYFTATHAGASRARHLEVDAISETDGQAYVRKFKLSGDNRFELQNQPGQTR
jgi:hypothetical protein